MERAEKTAHTPRRERVALWAAGLASAAALLAGLISPDNDNKDDEPLCGTGTVAAKTGTAWQVAVEAARDARIAQPDISAAASMLHERAGEVHAGQEWVICFRTNGYPVLAERAESAAAKGHAGQNSTPTPQG